MPAGKEPPVYRVDKSLIKLRDEKLDAFVREMMSASAKALAEQIDDKNMRPMITEALFRLGYTSHSQTLLGLTMENDNSIMAKHIVKIVRDIFFLFSNKDGENITKKYKHQH